MLYSNTCVVFWILKSKRLFFAILGFTMKSFRKFFLSEVWAEVDRKFIDWPTRFSSYKLLFLTNSSAWKKSLDFKIQKTTQVLKYVFIDLAVGIKCTGVESNFRIIFQNFRSIEFLILWVSLSVSRNIHPSLSKIVK